MGPDGLASASHSPADRGGAVGGAAAASPEPPGLRRPKASHPPAGRPEPRAAPPTFPFAGAGGERPQMAVGWGRRQSNKSSTMWCWSNLLRGSPRRPRSGSSVTARRRWTWPSNSQRTRWWHATVLAKPYQSVSLSLPSPSFAPPIFLPRSRAGVVPRAQPRWRGGPAPESTAARAHAREAGATSPNPAASPVPRGLHANSLSPFPPLGWRGSLGRPAGVAGTRATLSIVVR